MLRVGRPRKHVKDLPLGVYPRKGRYYVFPVNQEMRRVFAVRFPGKNCAPLGPDKAEARKLWVKLFATDVPAENASAGTIAEIIERYERDILPNLIDPTKAAHTSHCKALKAAFGRRRYAKSEAEATSGNFVRSIDITQYLCAEAKRQVFNKRGVLIADGRPVAANKEIQCFSRMFRLAKTQWGYTEYNPCLQVEYNFEEQRDQYHDDAAFMKVYNKASPIMQCMMDLAQMNGVRRGMLIRLMLSDIDDARGVWFTLNKRRRTQKTKKRLATWTPDLRAVIDRALAERAKVRGGQKDVLDSVNAPLFLNQHGKQFTNSGFNSQWYRARSAAGFGKHEYHFHDNKAKSLSDSPSLADAMERGDHIEPRTTRRVYRRKPVEVIPLARVSGKKS